MISRIGLLIALCIMLGFSALEFRLHESQHRRTNAISLSKLPYELGDFKGQDSNPLTLKERDILKLDQFVRRTYSDSKGRKVFLYLAYWDKQNGEHQAAKHSPAVCLPANGWKLSSVQVKTINDSLRVKRVESTLKSESHLFYYYFFSGEEIYVDETSALLHILKESLLNSRSDGGLLEISTELSSRRLGDMANTEADELLSEFSALLQEFLKENLFQTKSSAVE